MDSFALNSRRLSKYLRTVACIGFTGLVILSLLTMVDGVSRWLALPRIPGFLDISEVVYAIVITCCFPALLLRDHNVTIRFLGKAIGGRTHHWLEFFGNTFTLIFFAVLVWQFYLLTLDLQLNNRTSATLEFPVAPWWWITSFIMTITVPVQALVVYDSLYSAIFGVESRLPKDDAEGV